MAFYTALTKAEIEEFLQSYSLPSLQMFEGVVEGFINSTYRLTFEGGEQGILTLYERDVQKTELRDMGLWLAALSKERIPVPLPFKGRDGGMCYPLKDSLAIVARYLPGASVFAPGVQHVARLGLMLAKMHHIGRNYAGCVPSSSWTLETLPSHLKTCTSMMKKEPSSWRSWEEPCQKVFVLLESLFAHRARRIGIPFGVIHGDLFPNNVFFQKETISGVLDFDFFDQDYLAYDLAVCLCAWCFDERGFYHREMGCALLKAYHQERPLKKEEKEIFSLFCLGACVRFFLGRLLLLSKDFSKKGYPDPMFFIRQMAWHQKARFKDYGDL